MNIEEARFNMIQKQILPWHVSNHNILNLFTIVKREEFVPVAYKKLAFCDIEIPLLNNENMLFPKIEARILQEACIQPYEEILEIGTGSGYMTALLAYVSKHVTTVEINAELKLLAEKKLLQQKLISQQILIELGDGSYGWKNKKYDVIIITGSLPYLPDAFLKQIKIYGRILAIIGTQPIMTLQITTRISHNTFNTLKVFELLVKPLHTIHPLSHFSF